MKKDRRKKYTKEFQEQSVALAHEIGYSQTSRQLGVSVSSLHKWSEKQKKSEIENSENKSKNINYEEEYKKVKKELEEQKKINTILKAAAAFFSQDHLK